MTLLLNLMQGLLKQRRQGSVLDLFFFFNVFFLFFFYGKKSSSKDDLECF